MNKETKAISKTWTIGQVLALDESFAEIFLKSCCSFVPLGGKNVCFWHHGVPFLDGWQKFGFASHCARLPLVFLPKVPTRVWKTSLRNRLGFCFASSTGFGTFRQCQGALANPTACWLWCSRQNNLQCRRAFLPQFGRGWVFRKHARMRG